MNPELRSTARCPKCDAPVGLRLNPAALTDDSSWLDWVATVTCPKDRCGGIITVRRDSLEQAA